MIYHMTNTNSADDKDDKKETSDEDFKLGVKIGKKTAEGDEKSDADKKTAESESK